MTRFAIYQFDPKADFCRPPDWRWQLSKDGMTHVTDPWCELLLAYQRDPAESSIRGAVNSAREIFDGNPLRHAELEARILGNQPVEEIAEKLGLTKEVIELYEAAFYEVRSRLRAPTIILTTVINPTRVAHLPPFDVADLWRYYAYQHGVGVLDQLVQGADYDELAHDGIDAYLRETSRLVDDIKNLIRNELARNPYRLLGELLIAFLADQSPGQMPEPDC